MGDGRRAMGDGRWAIADSCQLLDVSRASVYATDVERGNAARGGSWPGPSSLALIIVLLAAGIGALELARQRPIVPPPPPPPPAWPLAGHDAARSAHSLSDPVVAGQRDLTLRWRRAFTAPPLPARAPVFDGYGNLYLPRSDGALLSLNAASGDTRWCAAAQPITDTACAGPQPSPGQSLPPPVGPNAAIGSGNGLYVVDGQGGLSRFDPSSPAPLWRAPLGLIPGEGVVLGPDGGTLYGVVAGPARALYAVAALRPRRPPAAGWDSAPGWHPLFIHASRLSPVSVAPDGTPLVAAGAPTPGGAATLYALGGAGGARWRVVLPPGHPSYATVEGTARRWVAWVVVTGATRSWVVVVDSRGGTLWRWSTGHPLDTTDGGIALSAEPSAHMSARMHNAIAYVSSAVGIYALDRGRRHSWLFFDTRPHRGAPFGYGNPGAPITDVRDTVYVATDRGYVFDIWRYGGERWRYNTGRDARGALALDPQGNVLVASRDMSGAVVLESLGAPPPSGFPLSTPAPGATTLACADSDCPTAAPTPPATAPLTPTTTLTPTATITVTLTSAATAIVTLTPSVNTSTPGP